MANQPLPAGALLAPRGPDLTSIAVLPDPLPVAEAPLSDSIIVTPLIPLLASKVVAHLIGRCRDSFVSFIFNVSEKYRYSLLKM